MTVKMVTSLVTLIISGGKTLNYLRNWEWSYTGEFCRVTISNWYQCLSYLNRFSVAWTRIVPTGYLDSYNQAGVDYYVNFVKVSYYTLQFFLIHINLHLVGLKRSRHWAFSYSIPLGLASTSKRSRRMAERLYCWTFWRIRQDCLPEFGTLRPEMGYCERTQDYLLSGIWKWSMSILQ